MGAGWGGGEMEERRVHADSNETGNPTSEECCGVSKVQSASHERRRKNAPHPNQPPQMGGGDLKDAMCVKFVTLASSRGVGGERRTASKKMCPPDRGWGGGDTSLPTNGISLSRRHSAAAPANRHCRRAAPHPNPPPLWGAGTLGRASLTSATLLSGAEIEESRADTFLRPEMALLVAPMYLPWII